MVLHLKGTYKIAYRVVLLLKGSIQGGFAYLKGSVASKARSSETELRAVPSKTTTLTPAPVKSAERSGQHFHFIIESQFETQRKCWKIIRQGSERRRKEFEV
jgi:guanylate kinase